MKIVYILTVLMFLTLVLNSQIENNLSIEDIRNDDDALKFVNSIDGFYTPNFKFLSETELKQKEIETRKYPSRIINMLRISDSLNIKNYYISDIDKNGMLDISIRGDICGFQNIILLNQGNGKFKEYSIFQTENILIRIVTKNSNPLIEYYSFEGKGTPRILNLRKDTLIFRSGRFLEYSEMRHGRKIEKIEFNAGFCQRQCPVFKMEIDKNRNALYTAEKYNYTKKPKRKGIINKRKRVGRFTTVLKEKEYSEIFELLNTLDIDKIKNRSVGVMIGGRRQEFKIIFEDGDILETSIHGFEEDYTLQYVYSLIEKLIYNQNWKRDSK